MSSNAEIFHLHLQYRLWIAELNSLIDQIRVLNDHLHEMPVVLERAPDHLDAIKKALVDLRLDIDDLRNKMHLGKMEFAALLKQEPVKLTHNENIIETLEKRYRKTRGDFEQLKQELLQFS